MARRGRLEGCVAFEECTGTARAPKGSRWIVRPERVRRVREGGIFLATPRGADTPHMILECQDGELRGTYNGQAYARGDVTLRGPVVGVVFPEA